MEMFLRCRGAVCRLAPLLLAVGVVLSSAHAQEITETKPSDKIVSFDILEYRVLGNTTLSAAKVEAAIYPFTGPSRSMKDVEDARQALEKAYHDAGYGTVFVDIPEQSADEGIVRLQVTEGRVDRVRITGSRFFANREIRAAVPSLAQGAVPLLPQVQQELTQLNRETTDRAIVPVMKAGRTPGTIDVELKVSDSLPFHGSLELNDRYTSGTERLRANAGLSYDRLFGDTQSISLQYQTAPQNRDNLEAYVLSYVFRLPDWNSTFAFYGVDSDTDVAALGTLGVIGKGQIFGARYIRELPMMGSYSHSVQLGADYKDFIEDIRQDESSGLRTPVRYLNWSVGYDSSYRKEHFTDDFSITANFGMRGAVNDPELFADKRYRGSANYFYLRGSIQHLQRLPWTMQTYTRLSGQFTQDALLSNEQLSIGGVDTVRGYFESSVAGDYGVDGSLELRSVLPSVLFKRPADSIYIFAFYDAGRVIVVHGLPAQENVLQIASTGVGFRIRNIVGLDAAFDWAQALKDANSVERGDRRMHFSVRYAF